MSAQTNGYQILATTIQGVFSELRKDAQGAAVHENLEAVLKAMLMSTKPVSSFEMLLATQQTYIDALVAALATFDQEWCKPDGRLLLVASYPKLFEAIGYSYGWADTNPGPTITYSFTDNSTGSSDTYVHPSDLDIDGNALPVPDGTSPLYFRIPNLSGRFLRCAGEATYVNKWQDSDGTTRQVKTTYSATAGRGQLDAQRGITGNVELRPDLVVPDSGVGALFPYGSRGGYPASTYTSEDSWYRRVGMNTSKVTPTGIEGRPSHIPFNCLLRIS